MARIPRVLIVARQTATSDQIYAAVARRAREGPCTFTLLVPLPHLACIASPIRRSMGALKRRHSSHEQSRSSPPQPAAGSLG